ncbi:hypothetical protein E2562_003555 [Oryza meyeriana var. granulata]|uniref:DUF834 domain-containing protein n=1 Tax=Oryza meyeriana var. granulata TaxID=110450 RepID=A0A6G1CPK9_9ORYZ|nr:hypothetical protein E2562_003555 [Oryza meyeriana var. granulata]
MRNPPLDSMSPNTCTYEGSVGIGLSSGRRRRDRSQLVEGPAGSAGVGEVAAWSAVARGGVEGPAWSGRLVEAAAWSAAAHGGVGTEAWGGGGSSELRGGGSQRGRHCRPRLA